MRLEQEFIDCLHQLVHLGEESELDYLKAKPRELLSQDDKRRLTQLLQHQQKRRLRHR